MRMKTLPVRVFFCGAIQRAICQRGDGSSGSCKRLRRTKRSAAAVFPRTNRPALYLQARLNTGLSRSPDSEIFSAARPSQENPNDRLSSSAVPPSIQWRYRP